jgi:nitroreductase
MVYNLIEKCRSYRRFDASKPIPRDTLISFVKSARVTGSGANRQKLRYSLYVDKAECDRIFSTLKFAAYLTEWSGPSVEERAVAYIVISSDSELNAITGIDLGLAAEAIALTAAEEGIGYCMFASFDKNDVKSLIGGDNVPHIVLAFGYPSETVLIEDAVDGNTRYYRDELDRHIVPKLPLDELIIN